MGAFFAKYWTEILLTLITTGSLALCKYAFKQAKNYKKLLEAQDQHEIEEMIKAQIKPVLERVEEINDSLTKMQMLHNAQLEAIVRSYRMRLIKLCKRYLDQGYMTSSQFEELSEFYKVYHDLGGNGQAKEYYDKAKDLPIKD